MNRLDPGSGQEKQKGPGLGFRATLGLLFLVAFGKSPLLLLLL